MSVNARAVCKLAAGLAITSLALFAISCANDDDDLAEPAATTVDTGATATVDTVSTATQGTPEALASTGQGAIDNRSMAAPARDTIFSCNADALGQALDRPWVDGQGVIDFDAKPVVEGDIRVESEFEVTSDADALTINTNGIPDHFIGGYPAPQGSEAFTYDPNPNAISVQDLVFVIPAEPIVAGEPGCLPFGPIAVALSGAVIFNALDAEVRDAVANEVFDTCEGHPAQGGIYHYHHYSPCWDQGEEGGHSPLVAYALDGFGIYGPRDVGGALIANDELDECHGHTGSGPTGADVYHYHATEAFPYTLGCYRGVLP